MPVIKSQGVVIRPSFGPKQPKSTLAKVQPERMTAQEFQRDAWMKKGAVLVYLNDSRLTAYERRLINGIGTRFFGVRDDL